MGEKKGHILSPGQTFEPGGRGSPVEGPSMKSGFFTAPLLDVMKACSLCLPKWGQKCRRPTVEQTRSTKNKPGMSTRTGSVFCLSPVDNFPPGVGPGEGSKARK